MEQSNDGIKNLDLLYILDVEPFDLSNPRRLNKVQEVTKYFENREDFKQSILDVLGKDTRSDKLDAVWVWVQLQNSKDEALKLLKDKDFAPDIEKELEQGFLTEDSIMRIRESIEELKKIGSIEGDESSNDVDSVENVLDNVETINSELMAYN